MQRILFVTGRLAEHALRRQLTDLAPRAGFASEVAVLPITVAALLTTEWVARHLTIPEGINRILLPGLCRGDLIQLKAPQGIVVERGPKDLRDLPEHFGKHSVKSSNYGRFDIEILAEINHAPTLSLEQIAEQADHYRRSGAEVIDLGCDPGTTWTEAGNATAHLKKLGHRVSIDSFNPIEVELALAAGAELVLSVNSSNLEKARSWHDQFPHMAVVVIPDSPSDSTSLDRNIEFLRKYSIPFRADPIIEPIGFGFAASLGRYLNFHQRYPDIEMMMGVGNLTELTDVDSAGMNVLLAGFCQELGIRSVLTTEVIPWCQSSVREFALARQLVYHAIHERVLPKKLEPGLIMLRDAKVYEQGEECLAELARQVTDRNYRLFAERGEIHVLNGQIYLHSADPFELFTQLLASDPRLDASHAFYLGYEMAKAVTALTLGKNYVQDQALRWGFLTLPEKSHREQH